MSSPDRKSIEINYAISPRNKKLVPLIGLGLFLIGLFSNLEIKSSLLSGINSALSSNRACPASVDTIDWNILNLGADLRNISFSPKCPKNIKQIGLKEIRIGFRGPSFSPLGIKLKTIIETNRTQNLETYLSFGATSFKATIDSQMLNLSTLKSTANLPVDLSGDLMINGIINGRYQKVSSFDLALSSPRVGMPSQSIQGLSLPGLNFHDLNMVIKSNDGKKIEIKQLKLGKKTDKIQLMAQGDLKLNKPMTRSSLKFEGKFNLSSQIKEELPIINLLLTGKKKTQGFYQFSLTGNISKPNFKFR